MKKAILILFSLICSLINPSKADTLPHFRLVDFSTESGLSQKRISDILQDHRGYIWLSSWSGLTRFDGYYFANFMKSKDNPHLPTNSRMRSIVEDNRGNIWCISYDRKVYVFNTLTYCYRNPLANAQPPIDETYQAKSIIPLSNGNIWVICNDGMAFRLRYADQHEGFHVQTYTPRGNIYTVTEGLGHADWMLTDKGVIDASTNQLLTDINYAWAFRHEDRLLIYSHDGILAWWKEGNAKPQPIETPQERTGSVTLTPISQDLYAWFDEKRFRTFCPSTQSFRDYPIPLLTTSAAGTILKIYAEPQRYVWLLTSEAIAIKIDLETGENLCTPIPGGPSNALGDERIPSFFQDRNGVIWTTTSDGFLAYFDKGGKKFCKVVQTENELQFTANRFRDAFFSDHQGNLWIPTLHGLSKISFPSQTAQFRQLDINYETRALCTDHHKRLWAGTKAGIVRLFDAHQQLIGYLTPDGRITDRQTRFADAGIYCISQDADGNLWIGTKGKGLYFLTPRSHSNLEYKVSQHTHRADHPGSLSNDNIYSIYQDRQKHIWIGSYGGGLNLVSRTGHEQMEFVHADNGLSQYPMTNYSYIRCMGETTEGILLAGTTEGIVAFDTRFASPKDIRFHEYQNNAETKHPITGSDIMSILTTRKGETFLTTLDGEINRIVPPTPDAGSLSFETMPLNNPTSAPRLFLSLVEGANSNLWIVSEDALIRYNLSTGTPDIFKRRSLIGSNNFSEAMPATDGQGNLLFGTETGILTITPSRMMKSTYTPPIVFTQVTLQGEPLTETDWTNGLVLPADKRDFSLSFAALDYVNAQEIDYTYRLEGYDKEWNFAGKNRSVNYANLRPGEYVFQVKSTNSDGVWSENTQELKITVTPRFAETIWANLLIFVAVIALSAIIIYILLYIYRLRYKVDFEQRLTNAKLRFFTDISHELRTPLTLISGPVTELMHTEGLPKQAKEYLSLVNSNVTRMTHLINEILDFRKIQDKKMKLIVENTDMVWLVQKVMQHFEVLKEEKQIDFKFVCNATSLYAMVDRDKMEMVLFNLISNAFKYTPSGKSITIGLQADEKQFTLSVSDEGIGILPEKLEHIFAHFESLSAYNPLQPSSGIGLALVKELVELHHGHIDVVSAKGKGSTFTLSLPMGWEHFRQDEATDCLLNDGTPVSSFPEEEPLPTSESDSLQTILIVEDNADLRQFLRSVLISSYRIIEAENGREGLEKARTELPDFILTDVMMPEMDGLDMVKAIKADKDIWHIPIIILSAKSSLDDRISGLESGIEDYIVKPFSTTLLKAKIASVIERRRKLQEFYAGSMTQSLGNMAGNASETSAPEDATTEHNEMEAHDRMFIEQLTSLIEANMDNADLEIETLAEAMNFSRSVFYRKVRSILGMSPVDVLRKARIRHAATLIKKKHYTLSEVAYMSGFNDPKYFGKCFKKEMGMNPSEYAEKH